jgi:hypothetical protein
MVPPGTARERPGEAAVLGRVALYPLVDEGKGPGGTAEAQGDQNLGAPLGRGTGQLQLLLQVAAKEDAAAVVQQPLQAGQGRAVLLLAAPQVAVAAAQGCSSRPRSAPSGSDSAGKGDLEAQRLHEHIEAAQQQP